MGSTTKDSARKLTLPPTGDPDERVPSQSLDVDLSVVASPRQSQRIGRSVTGIQLQSSHVDLIRLAIELACELAGVHGGVHGPHPSSGIQG